MLTLYLAALIFGAGTLLLQLAFSSDAGGDGDMHGGDLHGGMHGGDASPGDLEGAAEAHVPAQLSGGGDSAALAHAAPSDAGWASIFLSLRFYTFASMAFGLVGAPATWLELSGPVPTLVVALATAVGLGLLASLGFRVLGRQTLTSGGLASDLVGQVGRVLVTCEKGRLGKVRLNVRGQIVDYIASTGDARLEPGTSVIVEDVREGRLEVSGAPRELLVGQDGGGDRHG